ncbi:two-component system sensor histidine kinase NtrB [Bacillus marinisedimentorum]|uniref:two-component system sensor histidine kinase NtrB n=1 Tax=Bacillus marinisedimentorum TaxID=1821260 RepID=UPI00087276D8|nr:ATP-binding protein [Bacillus marinisedimentorum]
MGSQSARLPGSEKDCDITTEMRFVLGLNGEVLEMNENAARVLGDKKERFYDYFHPSHRDTVFQFLKEISDNGFARRFSLYHSMEEGNVLTLYNGKRSGEFLYLAGMPDVRVLAENQVPLHQLLKLSDKDLVIREFLSQKLDLSIVMLNRNNELIFCNEAFSKLFGLACGPVFEGRTISELETDIPLKGELKKFVQDLRSSGKTIERYYYEDESLYHIQGVYIPDSDSLFMCIHDRSYQQRFEKLMLYKQQMESVSQLAAGVAHELRNPLSVIRGFLQLSFLTNDWKKYYHTILSEVTRMNEIIEDFLSVSRKKITKRKQIPADIFHSLIYIIRSECLLHDITFEYQIEETEREVEVNEGMIKQILLNLLRNSIEAYEGIKKDRKFILQTYVSDSEYVVNVCDHGPGIPAEVLEQLGKPFFTTKENGNGVGIPLSKNIIENHGGTFSVESEPDRGTRTTFTLPFV